MDCNQIAAVFLCRLCNKLPVDPVVWHDGLVYEKSELEFFIKENEIIPIKYYPSSQIKHVLKLLIEGGNIDERYVGDRDKENEPEGITNDSHAKNTTAKNEEKHDGHFSLVKAKADAGDASYMVELGELYLKGSGTPKDEQVGYHWFDLASNVQNELGTARKADCLLAGLGVQQNTAEGQTILTEAVLEDHSGKEDLMPSWMFAYHKQ